MNATPQPMRARLIDVANAAGVTKSVVSRALNGDTTLSIRDETRARILETALALNYEPHAGARALAGARTRSIALLVPDLTNAVYARIARGTYLRARERGFVVLLAEDAEWSETQSDYTDLVSAGRVEGLLIASVREKHPLLEDGRLDNVPHVFVNRTVAGSNRNVGVDMANASKTALDYLYGLGHRTLGHISGPGDVSPARERERGFILEAVALGIARPCVVREPYTEAGGYVATQRILDTDPAVTAIYAGTLPQSIGALKALHDLGKRVPEDVSLLSYDDMPVAAYLQPSLTTMALPLQELGTAATDALLDQLSGIPPSDVILTRQPEVIERDSTAPPRQ
ncbi:MULTISPECIES: LacI family DNA-binding transcriptional regulator [unclassified Pseudoclavibacter]|uniref:LacI family DNA-binding transcriptional regulator n=1 Tax=unclassified Pseudoclavibacter TaxID=2615177 RepID=UPI001BA78908|nr:LacI family DNA-binding transcriptional regulator [Pseudoclavibacter sp. Marseille-Q4354]MBS3179137.1 LacI family DNA-binding transcriptional regulator [Pseudoclavibacter sp. Marseille-Q4354]